MQTLLIKNCILRQRRILSSEIYHLCKQIRNLMHILIPVKFLVTDASARRPRVGPSHKWYFPPTKLSLAHFSIDFNTGSSEE